MPDRKFIAPVVCSVQKETRGLAYFFANVEHLLHPLFLLHFYSYPAYVLRKRPAIMEITSKTRNI